MTSFVNVLRKEFLEKSILLKNQKGEKVKNTKEYILWAESKIDELHQLLKTHDFEDEKEEIEFFKEIKPCILSKLIFHKEQLRIMTNAPCGKCLCLKFYEEELFKISQNQNADLKFYNYYKSLSNELDAFYFTRKTKKCILETDSSHIGLDKRISTCYDYKIAAILANEELIFYIENRIKKVKFKSKVKNKAGKKFLDIQSNLKWTGSKIDLIELVYALHLQKVFNGGNTDIKEISSYIGKMFNIEIEENIYRNYLDLKTRKSGHTKFLDSLSEILNKKIVCEEY